MIDEEEPPKGIHASTTRQDVIAPMLMIHRVGKYYGQRVFILGPGHQEAYVFCGQMLDPQEWHTSKYTWHGTNFYKVYFDRDDATMQQLVQFAQYLTTHPDPRSIDKSIPDMTVKHLYGCLHLFFSDDDVDSNEENVMY